MLKGLLSWDGQQLPAEQRPGGEKKPRVLSSEGTASVDWDWEPTRPSAGPGVARRVRRRRWGRERLAWRGFGHLSSPQGRGTQVQVWDQDLQSE